MKSIVLSPQVAVLVHLVFEWSAIVVGMQIYRWQKAKAAQGFSVLQEGNFAIVMGCILGAAVGNKLVFWLEVPHLWQAAHLNAMTWMAGQSIVGGLLGGLIGVELAKKMVGSSTSTGDAFVLPLIVGTIIGRIGCFLAGLQDGTFGLPTQAVWGIDFGDGIARHPTQIYDMLFVAVYGGFLLTVKKFFAHKSGLVFKCYLAGYLLWRLCIDSVKPLPYDYGMGFSGIQLVCLLALLIYLPLLCKQLFTGSGSSHVVQ